MLILQSYYKQALEPVKLMGALCVWMLEKKALDNEAFFINTKVFVERSGEIAVSFLPYFSEIIYYFIKYNQYKK